MLGRFWQMLSLTAPDFRDPVREAKLTRGALVAIFCGLVITIILELILMRRPVLRAILWSSLGATVFAYMLVERGNLRDARLLIVVAALVAINANLYTGISGVHSVGTMLYPAVIVLSSLLLGRRGFILLTALTVISAGGLVVADIHDVLHTPYHDIAQYVDVLGPICILLFTALLVRLLAADIVRTASLARRNERELGDANKVLARRTAELEQSQALLQASIEKAKAAEAERERMQLRAQQIQKLESLGMLAGGVAHDFNNLLMAILGNIDMAMARLPNDSEVIGFLRDADASSRRATELTQRMLAYSGRSRFVVQRMNVNDLVEEMAPMLRMTAGGRASIHLQLADELPDINADEPQMREVIAHLVTNAVEAMDGAPGDVTVSTGMADCLAEDLVDDWLHTELPAGQYVWLHVSDTGPGITDDNMKRIFDPFFSTKFTGRGLGLPAVLGIVRGHQGLIRVRSKIGKGTSFRVMLPAAAPKVERDVVEMPSAPLPHGTGTVLLVDDEDAVRAIAALMLERLGYSVIQASDGDEALEIFAARGAEIRGVVLDVTMPRLNGLETLLRLRQMDPSVRVVMSSGFAEQDVVERATAAGSFAFIQKPYEIRTLADLLTKALA